MRFALWMKQAGGGCDYMVGCGEKMKFFEAENVEEAIKRVIQLDDCEHFVPENEAGILSWHGLSIEGGERSLERAILFPLESGVDIGPLYAKAVRDSIAKTEADEATLAAYEAEQRDKAEFSRLKKKFAKTS